jgi:hypothetical protein
LFLFVVFINFNPFGLGQIIIWQMRPPYHWVVEPYSLTEGSDFLDRNNKTCASLWKSDIYGGWRVYGMGFAKTFNSRAYAVAKAERECR